MLNGVNRSYPPPPAPHTRIQSDESSQSSIFLISLIIPLTACVCACLVCFLFQHRKKLVAYHLQQEGGEGDDRVSIDLDPHHPPELTSEDMITYTSEIVDPTMIALGEQEELFPTADPVPPVPIAAAPLPTSARPPISRSSSSSGTSLSFMDSFSLPLTDTEREKKKSSLQFSAPKRYSTDPLASHPAVSASTLISSRPSSSFNGSDSSRLERGRSLSQSSSSSSQSKISSVPSEPESGSSLYSSSGAYVVPSHRAPASRPIAHLFERDIFEEDYSSHSMPDTQTIELMERRLDPAPSLSQHQEMESLQPLEGIGLDPNNQMRSQSSNQSLVSEEDGWQR
jgi:hypothetical protein